jgi:hypothetical protein
MAKQFRILRGCLPITVNDVTTVYGPGDTVKDKAHLEALGDARIALMIEEGFAETVTFVEGVLNAVKPAENVMPPEEKKTVTETFDTASKQSKAKQSLASARAKADKEAGVQTAGPVLVAPSGTAVRS